MKYYYCRVEIGGDYPDYDFVINAENDEQAQVLAEKEADCYDWNEVYIREVNADSLLKVMLIN
jgi:hypothetical protein